VADVARCSESVDLSYVTDVSTQCARMSQVTDDCLQSSILAFTSLTVAILCNGVGL